MGICPMELLTLTQTKHRGDSLTIVSVTGRFGLNAGLFKLSVLTTASTAILRLRDMCALNLIPGKYQPSVAHHFSVHIVGLLIANGQLSF